MADENNKSRFKGGSSSIGGGPSAFAGRREAQSSTTVQSDKEVSKTTVNSSKPKGSPKQRKEKGAASNGSRNANKIVKPAGDLNRVFHLRLNEKADLLLRAYVDYTEKTQTKAINGLITRSLEPLLASDAEFKAVYESLKTKE